MKTVVTAATSRQKHLSNKGIRIFTTQGARSRQDYTANNANMNVVARLARSWPNISTKTSILSLILDVVEPPIPGMKQPPISEDLQKALGDIERGAEKRIELLKGRKREAEAKSKEEMKPVVGHVELVEKKELAEEEKDDGDGEQDRPHK